LTRCLPISFEDACFIIAQEKGLKNMISTSLSGPP